MEDDCTLNPDAQLVLMIPQAAWSPGQQRASTQPSSSQDIRICSPDLLPQGVPGHTYLLLKAATCSLSFGDSEASLVDDALVLIQVSPSSTGDLWIPLSQPCLAPHMHSSM